MAEMKYGILSLLLIVAIVSGQEAYAAPFDLVFQKADAQTFAIINNLLPGEIAAEERSSRTPFGQQYPSHVLVARAKVSESEPPYLFVEIVGPASGFCGNVNCSIWGFESTKYGWRKVFSNIGYQWTVLLHSEGDHHDILERFHDSGSEYTLKTFQWAGHHYRQSRSRDISK